MYLSNSERIRLGLQHYGSDVPDHVVAAAEAALAGAACPAPTPEPTAEKEGAGATLKKRARTAKGKFQADDPLTPDTNEAWEQASA